MMKVFANVYDLGVAVDLSKVEAVFEQSKDFVRLQTDQHSYTVRGIFDDVVAAVEHEKDARCV